MLEIAKGEPVGTSVAWRDLTGPFRPCTVVASSAGQHQFAPCDIADEKVARPNLRVGAPGVIALPAWHGMD